MTTQEDACIFCKIVRGDAPGHKIWEDDTVLVFLDLFPASPGHTLVIPKAHAENVFEIPESDLEAVARVSKRVSHAIKSALTPDGVGVFQLNGSAAGQTVFHYHMHLIPRNHGDPVGFHGRKQADAAALDQMAGRIREALQA